jgi:FkbH-like protein
MVDSQSVEQLVDMNLSILQGEISPRTIDALRARLSEQDAVCDAGTLDAMEHAARRIASSDSSLAHQLAESLASHSGDGSRWLRACLLEFLSRPQEAARVLEGAWEGLRGEERARLLIAYARNLLRAGETDRFWRPLAEAMKANPSHRLLRAADRLLNQARRNASPPSRRRSRIALVGSVTLDFLVPALRVQCFAAGVDAEFYAGAFNQYQQEILDPNSGLARFAPSLVVIFMDSGSLALHEEASDPAAKAGETIAMLRELWRECRERLNAFVVQCNFEITMNDPMGRLGALAPGGRSHLLRRLNADLFEADRTETGVAILDVEQIASEFGKERWSDPVLWHAARQYPAADAIPALTRGLVSLLRAALGLSSKCLVIDLDGVLWGGVIGEDGLNGIELGGSAAGEAFVAFQRYIRSLARRGVLVAVCSKNNPEDAMLPFSQHREMALKETDIAMFVANWRNKDENLRQIASALNIGLDSLVFVDDNPLERAQVRHALPEVQVVDLPPDPAHYIAALAGPGYFEALVLTEEDSRRGELIRSDVERKALQQQAGNLKGYLAGLGMKVRLAPFDEADLPRIVQLVNKTNQFNLTTRRVTDLEIRRLFGRNDCYTQSLRIADRFGDSGLTGVLIAFHENNRLRIHNWLISCRVLGRELDRVMFAALVRHARRRECEAIVGEYIPTAKNGQVSDLYERLGFRPVGDGVYHLEPLDAPFPTPEFIGCVDITGDP